MDWLDLLAVQGTLKSLLQLHSSKASILLHSAFFIVQLLHPYSGLISFRIDWFDILIVQRTLRSLLQHHISKASNLWRSAFFVDQLSHLYMTTGKQTRDNQIVKLSN